METSLYLPVKRFLEGLGFEVKGEVCGCDVVAVDRGAPIALVICELKLSFTLDLVLQAWIDPRLAMKFGSPSARQCADADASLTPGSKGSVECSALGCSAY